VFYGGKEGRGTEFPSHDRVARILSGARVIIQREVEGRMELADNEGT